MPRHDLVGSRYVPRDVALHTYDSLVIVRYQEVKVLGFLKLHSPLIKDFRE